MNAEKIELSEVIAQLRKELRKARAESDGESPKFVVEGAEIELKVGMTASVQGETGVQFWVYTAKLGGELQQESVQTIKLRLRPEEIGGGSYETEGLAPRLTSNDPD